MMMGDASSWVSYCCAMTSRKRDERTRTQGVFSTFLDGEKTEPSPRALVNERGDNKGSARAGPKMQLRMRLGLGNIVLRKRNFDDWVQKWGEGGPPMEEQTNLAWDLCSPESSGNANGRGCVEEESFVDSTSSSTDEKALVSWGGVSVEWFLAVFMKTSEAQRFLEFGCRMWFIRNVCIKVMLRRRGVGAGSIVNNLNRFVPEQEAKGTARRSLESINFSSSKASAFVSYTGSYTLEHFAELLGDSSFQGQYLWMDMLCVDQFSWTERKDDAMVAFKGKFMSQLKKEIQRIGFTALLLEEWDDLMSTLGQTWVVWELFSSVEGKADLSVVLRDTERERFISEGLGTEEGFLRISSALAEMDIRRARAFDPNDAKQILASIEEHDGVHKVNARVASRIREWLVETGQAHLEKQKAFDEEVLWLRNNLALLHRNFGSFELAERLQQESVHICCGKLGDSHPETLDCQLNWAILLNDLGLYAQAETVLREVCHVRRRDFGDRHPSTLNSSHHLANALQAMSKHNEAESLLRETLIARRETLPTNHPDILASIGSFALLLNLLGRHAEAEPLNREAVVGHRLVHGDRHPNTLRALDDLGTLLGKSGRFAEAESLLKQALLGKREQLGPLHSSTLKSMNNLASLLFGMGRHAEAEPLFREAAAGFQGKLGDKHPSTISCLNNLAGVLCELDKPEEAEPLLRRALGAKRESLGSNHHSTLVSIYNMGVFLFKMGKLSEAVSLLEEAYHGRMESFGPNHPSTNNALVALNEAKLSSQQAGQTSNLQTPR